MTYRPEIDGLRAIAVLSVVLYHAGVGLVPGGFVGVDVFFVISGYLITGIIWTELKAGRFSFSRFFERRVRRLFPALLLTLSGTTAAALALMTPTDLVAYAKDLVGGALFVANIVFWARAEDYFSAAPDLNTLLHLWSLAIEEQFYIFFPLCLIILRRLPQRWIAVVLTVAGAVSLVLAQRSIMRGSPGAFYLLPFRAWELLVGSLIVIGAPASPAATVAACVSAAGLAAIATGILGFSAAVPFPGVAALLPCIGTAAIIWSCSSCRPWTARFLSLPVLTYVGQLSYGFYLFHWPMLAFARYLLMRPLQVFEALAILAFALVLSAASLSLVERPLRYPGRSQSPATSATPEGGPPTPSWLRTPFGLTAAATAAILLVAGSILVADGFPARLNLQASRMEQYLGRSMQQSYRGGSCFLQLDYDLKAFDVSACATRTTPGAAVALWGDSLAAHFYPGLRQVLGRHGISVLQLTGASCPPLIGYAERFPPGCGALNDFYFRQIEKVRPEVVILSTRWSQVAHLGGLLEATINRLRSLGIQVVILGPGPSYSSAVPRLIARQLARDPTRPSDLRPYESQFPRQTDAALRRLYGSNPKVHYISVLDAACRDACPVLAGDVPAFVDGGHMTVEGSILYAERLQDQILAAATRRAN